MTTTWYADAEHPFRIDHCSSCHRPIIWCVTERQKRMPVDAVPPDKGGNVEVIPRKGIAAPLAKVLPVAKQFGKRGLRTSHFATCPNADRHRQAGRSRRAERAELAS
jgi:hypothetical protein